MKERVRSALEEGLRLKRWLRDESADLLLEMAGRCAACLRGGGKLLFAGNGGSAADSQHLATELVVRLSAALERPALAGLALTTDSSLLTACANDFSFEMIFQRQVEALGRPGDLLLLLSTSGRSANLLAAARRARELGLAPLGFCGGDGGALAPLCDLALIVPSANPGRVQELHITAGHILIDLVEQGLHA